MEEELTNIEKDTNARLGETDFIYSPTLLNTQGLGRCDPSLQSPDSGGSEVKGQPGLPGDRM